VWGVLIFGDGFQQCCDCGAGEGLGEGLGEFGPADELHGVGGELLAGVEEGAQHIPGGPAAPDGGGFVITGVGGERGAHRIFRYVSHREPCRAAVGHQACDRGEVLAVGLHGVRRRFPGLPIIQELRKPIREWIDLGRRHRRARAGFIGHRSKVAHKRWIINLIHHYW
jgi:hypothetical protein